MHKLRGLNLRIDDEIFSYNSGLNKLIELAQINVEECSVALQWGDVWSTSFKLRVSDLYFLELYDQSLEKFVPIPFSVSYTKLEKIPSINYHSVSTAIFQTKTAKSCKGRNIRILIFVIAEAAHFILIRRLIIGLFTSNQSEISLMELDVLIHNWSSLRKSAGRNQLIVSIQDVATSAKLSTWFNRNFEPNCFVLSDFFGQ